MTAVCASCVHLIIRDKGTPWLRWECAKRPREVTFCHVRGTAQADPPYLFCRDINRAGACPDFQEGANTLHPRNENDDRT